MDLQSSSRLPAFQIESQFESVSTSLSTPSSSMTAHNLMYDVNLYGENGEGIRLDQDQQLAEEDYREKTPVPPQTKLQVEIFNRIYLNIDHQEDELTPLSSSSSVDDEPQLQPQLVTPSTSNPPSIITSPTTPISHSKPILIRYFYPIDPVTSHQQQEAVYDDPRCPA
ncbi:hypothetical protein Clacol_010625, partial [Clathrus columnatus]